MVTEPGTKHVTGGSCGSCLHRMLGKKVKAARNLGFVSKCEAVRRCLYWALVFNLHFLYPSHCVCVCLRCILLWIIIQIWPQDEIKERLRKKTKQSWLYYGDLRQDLMGKTPEWRQKLAVEGQPWGLGLYWGFPRKGKASLVAQMVKNLPTMQETQVRSLGREHPVGQGMATHSITLAWKIPWTEGPGGPQSVGLHRVRHEWVTNAHTQRKDSRVDAQLTIG